LDSKTQEEEPEEEEREKVIVRSNGVVTYVGKDIAYQFWKLGLLGRDFPLARVRSEGVLGRAAVGDLHGRGRERSSDFGGAAYVYNVIDVRSRTCRSC
jgi:arginyl-tRNA synthetase